MWPVPHDMQQKPEAELIASLWLKNNSSTTSTKKGILTTYTHVLNHLAETYAPEYLFSPSDNMHWCFIQPTKSHQYISLTNFRWGRDVCGNATTWLCWKACLGKSTSINSKWNVSSLELSKWYITTGPHVQRDLYDAPWEEKRPNQITLPREQQRKKSHKKLNHSIRQIFHSFWHS